ncbi:hypothetical protein [Yunchengibacter salinarum]|uniref:hypothetical protein n=1 Tax=Yunchengibacter salinarum TaxID=3133399 RepID=UPI0035B5922F
MKYLCRLIGSLLCLVGLLGMLTPIPFGLIFFVLGLMFLIPSTPSAARPIQGLRGRIAPLDRAMMAMTRRLPVPFKRVLRQTEPIRGDLIL